MFDPVCKLLIEEFSTDFAAWLLGEPVKLSQLEPTELLLDPIRTDALMLLAAKNTLLHLEIQTQPDPEIPFRMLDYRVRAHRRYPTQPMKQVVIYLKQTASTRAYETSFSLENTHHQFEVIRLWEQPVEELMALPGLLPFAVLGETDDPEAVLRQVAAKIEEIDKPTEKARVASSAFVLSGLVLERALVEQIFMSELLAESVTYQGIKDEGRQEGLEQGLRQGLQAGIEEGKRQTLQKVVLRLLTWKLGEELSEEVSDQVTKLSAKSLESLSDALLEFTSLTALTTWLQKQAKDAKAE